MAGIFGIKDKHVTGLEMCVLFENERYRMNGREVVSKQRIYKIKSKTDRRKPHSMIIKNLLEEVIRLLSEHYAQTDEILGQRDKTQ